MRRRDPNAQKASVPSVVTGWALPFDPGVSRDILAGLACLATVASVAGGLFNWLPVVQIGVLAGMVVGLIAASVPRAMLVAAIAAPLGYFAGPSNPFSMVATSSAVRVEEAAALAVIAVCAAAATGVLTRRHGAAAWVLCALATALVIGNLWATTLTLDAQPTFDPTTQTVVPSLDAQLTSHVSIGASATDNTLLAWVAQSVRDGDPYYPSFRSGFVKLFGRAPSAVTNVRFPLISYVWAWLTGPSVVKAFLLMASLAILAAAVSVSQFVRLPLVVPTCAMLAAYFLYFGIHMTVYTPEVWAVAFALVSVAGYAYSLRSSSQWRAGVVVAVVAASVAVLVREVFLFVPIAGLVSSLVARDDQRRFRAGSWAVGLSAVSVALAFHYWLSRALIDPNSGYRQLAAGSFGNVMAGLVFATDYLGRGGWLAIAFAVLGIGGVLMVPDNRFRLYLAICVLVPLLSFLMFRNSAVSIGGVQINYWGSAVAPLLYSAVPFAFLLLPGAARRRLA